MGSTEKINWRQEGDALVIHKPVRLPAWNVQGFRIQLQ